MNVDCVSAAAPCPAPLWRDAQPGAPHVLLVEDDARLRGCLAEALTGARLHVTAVPDAEQALALSDPALVPDLLISDIGLPGIDGIALATIARQRWPHIGVILMSGVFANLMRQHLCETHRFLLKPFRTAELLHAIVDLTGRHAATTTASGTDIQPLVQRRVSSRTVAELVIPSPPKFDG